MGDVKIRSITWLNMMVVSSTGSDYGAKFQD